MERQKLLVSLPRSKPEQSIFALVAERVAELREMQEDVLLLLAAEDLNAQKAILVQHLRGLGAKTAKLLKVSTIAAKEGSSTAQRLFIPAPAFSDLDDKESRALEKIRKEQRQPRKRSQRRASPRGRCLMPRRPPPTATTTASRATAAASAAAREDWAAGRSSSCFLSSSTRGRAGPGSRRTVAVA